MFIFLFPTNKIGLSEQPCLTPEQTLKNSEIEDVSRAEQAAKEYNFCKMSTNLDEIPKLNNLRNEEVCSTV